MKTKKEVETQLKSYITRRSNIINEGWYKSKYAITLIRLNQKINTLKWVLS